MSSSILNFPNELIFTHFMEEAGFSETSKNESSVTSEARKMRNQMRILGENLKLLINGFGTRAALNYQIYEEFDGFEKVESEREKTHTHFEAHATW